MKRTLFVLLSLTSFCSSCKDNSNLITLLYERAETIYNQKKQIDSLQAVIYELELRQRQPRAGYSSNTSSPNYNALDDISAGQKIYYFIVLKVVEDKGYGSPQTLYSTTGVNTIDYIDESVKYKLLDDATLSYKKSPNGAVYNVAIKSRNIYTFGSYEEASVAREKYIMN